MVNLIKPRMVENFNDLEDLINYIILEQKEDFSKRDIINEVQESEFFNNFTTEAYLMNMVGQKINLLCVHKTLVKTETGKYSVIK